MIANEKGDMSKCLRESLFRLYYWITGQNVYHEDYGLVCPLTPTTPGPFGFQSAHFTSCDGGPTGTEPCGSPADCADHYDPATNQCCVIPCGLTYGWCETKTTPCP
jgi:hypothetical protein